MKYADSLLRSGWSAPIGVLVANGVRADDVERRVTGAVPADGASQDVQRRITSFERFFAKRGFRSPLRHQFEQFSRKGLPPGSALVRALLAAEMSTGLLMGAQDFGAVHGDVVFALARAGETFTGMRGEVQCGADEIVLRDDTAIIASLFQGPDARTRLTSTTADVIFFIFCTPELSVADVTIGVNAVQALFAGACARLTAAVYENGSAISEVAA